MPVFNAADSIERAIKSVLSQTFTRFEFLILDDGSTDNTVELITQFRDQRIRLIRLDHMGLAAALNIGIDKATTGLIARQDADDQSAPERFARQMQLFESDPEIDAVGSWWTITDIAGTALGTKRLPESDEELRFLFNRFNPFCHGSMIIKRKSLVSLGGYDANLWFAQDYDLWIRMAKAGMKFGCVQDALYFYEITPESVARARQKLAFSGALRQRSKNGSDAGRLVINNLPPMGNRQRTSFYRYTVGSLMLDEGRRWTACKSLTAAVAIDPLNWRAILKLLVTPLPNSMNSRVIGWFRQAAAKVSASKGSM